MKNLKPQVSLEQGDAKTKDKTRARDHLAVELCLSLFHEQQQVAHPPTKGHLRTKKLHPEGWTLGAGGENSGLRDQWALQKIIMNKKKATRHKNR